MIKPIKNFHGKIESIQYNACLPLTGAITGTSKEKLYQNLAFRITPTATMVQKTKVHVVFSKLIPERTSSYTTRTGANLTLKSMKHDFFKNSLSHLPLVNGINLTSILGI